MKKRCYSLLKQEKKKSLNGRVKNQRRKRREAVRHSKVADLLRRLVVEGKTKSI